MGIFGAMTTAISGLSSQSFALENISGNIANSRTTGFKRVDTSFADLVPDQPLGRELAGSVGAFSRNTATVQGDVQVTSIGTNVAISGEGFFVVKEKTSDNGGAAVFGGSNLYTRRGDFQLDRDGRLVSGTGYYLMGYPLNPTNGAQNGPLQVLQISANNLPARATGTITYNANLPKTPKTASYVASNNAANSELLSGDLQVAAIKASDNSTFLDQTIPGQTITTYDAAGSPISINLRWAKTSNTAGAETWSAYYESDTTATGDATRWTRIPTAITFNASGQMTAPANGIIAQTFTVNGATTPTINLNFGTTGLTQFSDANGSLNPGSLTQDGYPSGNIQNVSVGQGGRVMAGYSNGQTVAVAQIPLAQLPADNLMKRKDGGVFEATLESGEALLADAGRNIQGGAVENSNVDIADEFSKMIVTQQAYSANTKVVTTAQSMLQDVINIIR